MLGRLDDVAWHALSHAYGSAANVPAAIRRLASANPEDWVGAIDELYACLCHQTCSVYEATAPAIPFLVELLALPEIRCRARILELLGDMAAAGCHEPDRLRDVRLALWRGLDVYLRLVSDFNPRLRVSAPYTLALLFGHAEDDMPSELRTRKPDRTVAETLVRQLAEEPNDLVRASAVFGLATLAAREHRFLEPIRNLLSDDRRPVQIVAALCAAELEEDPPLRAVEVLSSALENWEDTDHLFQIQHGMENKHHPLWKAYRQAGAPVEESEGTGFDPDDIGAEEDFAFPWFDGWPRFTCIERICSLPKRHTARVLPALLAAMRNENEYTVDCVSAPILEYVMDGRKITTRTKLGELSHEQRAILTALYQNESMWGTRSGNIMMVFNGIGLPDDLQGRGQLGRLLGLES